MSYAKRQLIFYCIFTAIGVVAIVVALFANISSDLRTGAVSGIAGGFGITGILGIVQSVRLLKNPAKAEQIAIAKTEERNEFIRQKTRSAAYTTQLLILSLGTLIALLTGNIIVAVTLAAVLILQAILSILFSFYYSKKL